MNSHELSRPTPVKPFLPAIVPIFAVFLVYVTVLLTHSPGGAYFEIGSDWVNEEHRQCLAENARSHRESYKDVMSAHRLAIGAANIAYQAARLKILADAAKKVARATVLLAGNPPALAAELLRIAAWSAAQIGAAWLVKEGARETAGRNLEREIGILETSWENGEAACESYRGSVSETIEDSTTYDQVVEDTENSLEDRMEDLDQRDDDDEFTRCDDNPDDCMEL